MSKNIHEKDQTEVHVSKTINLKEHAMKVAMDNKIKQALKVSKQTEPLSKIITDSKKK